MLKIPFNKPCVLGNEDKYLQELIKSKSFAGDNKFTKACKSKIEELYSNSKCLMTPSGTAGLELATFLINLQPNDEVIMPSFTFSSTATSVTLRGAIPVFIDIRPDTMNIDEKLIEQAITSKTKAIIPVHYAGVSCEMDTIIQIAQKHNLKIIEDAAQAILCTYKGKLLGTFGEASAISFHETKNIQCGEGGAALINNNDYFPKAEIYREKGTDRSQFFRGEIDKYTWVDNGSSYLPSELTMAFLLSQLENINHIISERIDKWNLYLKLFKESNLNTYLEFPNIPDECKHNGHIFWIKTKDLTQRQRLIEYLKSLGISSVFHYVPLHSSPAGKRFGRFCGQDNFTTRESERLLRLPLYYGISKEEIEYVFESVGGFYNNRRDK